MGRWLLAAIVVALALGIAACGEDDDGAPPSPEPQAEEPAAPPAPEPEPEAEPEPEGADRFTGQDAQNYRTAEQACGAFPQRKVARDLGLPPDADVVAIAEAYADGYQPQFQQAAFEGCLEGLL